MSNDFGYPRVLFFGIYQIGAQCLTSLLDTKANVVGVVTNIDDSSTKGSVSNIAHGSKIMVYIPHSPRESAFVRSMEDLRPDIIVVAGYHKIIPKVLLDIPPLGTLNVHDSLLPRYRGPNSWKWAIANGESQTGVTIHLMEPELDTGAILAQEFVPITSSDNGATLFGRICAAASSLLPRVLTDHVKGGLVPIEQDSSQATYFGYLTSELTEINWSMESTSIHNLVRAANPSPGAWTMLRGERFSIWETLLTDVATMREVPGTVVETCADYIAVATGDGAIRICTVSRESLNPTSPLTGLAQSGVAVGDVFDSASVATDENGSAEPS